MSIRIHKLAEELGLDNKEMMSLLKERKIIAQDVKSVSSTVDNINASALRDEFAAKKPAVEATAPTPTVAPAASPASDGGTTEASAPKVSIPSGVFVKSKQDIDREKEAAAAARAAALKAAATPAAPPAAPAPAPMAPRPVSAPQPAAAPRYVS